MKKDKINKITVYLNDQPIKLYRGMKVKNALCAGGVEAINLELLSVVDKDGNMVGLEGGLAEGMRLYIAAPEHNEHHEK